MFRKSGAAIVASAFDVLSRMRKVVLFVFLIAFCAIGFTSLLSMKNNLGADHLAAKRLLEFKTELGHFKEQLNWLESDKNNATQLKVSYRNLRDKFKSLEFLLEFLDPAFHKDFLNGPPLPHLEKTAPSLLALEPHGLQVIDELMAEPMNANTIGQLKQEILLLQEQVKNYQFPSNLTQRMIYESIYTGLIRLYSLGLTGFDTPGTLCALEDSKAVLKSMREFIGLLEANTSLVDGAFNYLNHQNSFEKFDRLYFLIYHLNPMIKDLQEHKSKLGIESMEEVNPGKHALNYRSKNLFDPKLLYPEFYVKLPAKFNHSKAKELGELLFFDPILSANNKRSCASCHNPALAFTDGMEKSKGISPNVFVNRNSPGLINAVYSERFFWDLRAESLEDQTEHVIFSKEEFNTDYLTIFRKLAASKQYQELFNEVFPEFQGNSINKTTLSFALSAYVLSLTSFNTPFDKYIRGESNVLSEDAKKDIIYSWVKLHAALAILRPYSAAQCPLNSWRVKVKC